jgi:hypothetical protein
MLALKVAQQVLRRDAQHCNVTGALLDQALEPVGGVLDAVLRNHKARREMLLPHVAQRESGQHEDDHVARDVETIAHAARWQLFLVPENGIPLLNAGLNEGRDRRHGHGSSV